jgi:hypothetical protein
VTRAQDHALVRAADFDPHWACPTIEWGSAPAQICHSILAPAAKDEMPPFTDCMAVLESVVSAAPRNPVFRAMVIGWLREAQEAQKKTAEGFGTIAEVGRPDNQCAKKCGRRKNSHETLRRCSVCHETGHNKQNCPLGTAMVN